MVLGIIIILIPVCFVGCFNPRVGDVRSSKTTDFGHYDWFVSKKLKESAALFPIALSSQCQVSAYSYRYTCALLGDPGFYINVTIAYDNEESFNKEQLRIIKNSVSCLKVEEDKWLYLGYDLGQNIDLFFDNKIYDGLFFWMETVKANETSREITYSISLWWDYMEKDDIVMEIAKTVKILQSQQAVL